MYKELQDLATAEMSSLICHFLPCSLQAGNSELLRVLWMHQALGWCPVFTHTPSPWNGPLCLLPGKSFILQAPVQMLPLLRSLLWLPKKLTVPLLTRVRAHSFKEIILLFDCISHASISVTEGQGPHVCIFDPRQLDRCRHKVRLNGMLLNEWMNMT